MPELTQYFLATYTMTYGGISPKPYIISHNDYKRQDLFELAAKSEHGWVLWSTAAVVLLIRRQPWQERKSSEVIFVIPLEAATSASGRGFPCCLISYINHTIFMTITRAAVALVLQGSSVENADRLKIERSCREQSVGHWVRGRLSICTTQHDVGSEMTWIIDRKWESENAFDCVVFFLPHDPVLRIMRVKKMNE